jgi:uncharacterized membrane protein YvbJ
MVDCHNCGMKNDEDANFCKKCGANLNDKKSQNCNECGYTMIGNPKFCGECGTKIKMNK